MTKIQTNIGDLKRQLEDLQSITNANIARLQIHLDIVSSARLKGMSYKDQLNHREALSDYGADIRNYIRDKVSKIDKIAFDIFLPFCGFIPVFAPPAPSVEPEVLIDLLIASPFVVSALLLLLIS